MIGALVTLGALCLVVVRTLAPLPAIVWIEISAAEYETGRGDPWTARDWSDEHRTRLEFPTLYAVHLRLDSGVRTIAARRPVYRSPWLLRVTGLSPEWVGLTPVYMARGRVVRDGDRVLVECVVRASEK